MMEQGDPRVVLATLVEERGEDYASLSRLLGRNPAYIQQFIRRGTPKRLAEADRALLAAYFEIPEAWLGAPERREVALPALVAVPRLDVGASAGPGRHAEDRVTGSSFAFTRAWLRRLRPGGGGAGLSMIRVAGDSMAPTLEDGDEILVDGNDGAARLRDGIYVIRIADAVLVKRLKRVTDGFVIVSDNPQALPVDPGDPERLAILGRVLWTGRRL